jgi:hypothetical protein
MRLMAMKMAMKGNAMMYTKAFPKRSKKVDAFFSSVLGPGGAIECMADIVGYCTSFLMIPRYLWFEFAFGKGVSVSIAVKNVDYAGEQSNASSGIDIALMSF